EGTILPASRKLKAAGRGRPTRLQGINENHRLEILDGHVVPGRTYCYCPGTLSAVAEALGCPAIPRAYRSPSLGDVMSAFIGRGPRWRRRSIGGSSPSILTLPASSRRVGGGLEMRWAVLSLTVLSVIPLPGLVARTVVVAALGASGTAQA